MSPLDRALRVCDDLRKGENHLFTEADARQMFVEKFLSGREVDRCLVHLEYPTPYRTSVKGWFAPSSESSARRGHYDFLVFDPWFWDALRQSKVSAKAIMGRDFQAVVDEWPDVLEEQARGRAPVSSVIEFKYVTRSVNTTDEWRGVLKDLCKLWFSRKFPKETCEGEDITPGQLLVASGLCVVVGGDHGAPPSWKYSKTSTSRRKLLKGVYGAGAEVARELLSPEGWSELQDGIYWYTGDPEFSQFRLGLTYLPTGEPQEGEGGQEKSPR